MKRVGEAVLIEVAEGKAPRFVVDGRMLRGEIVNTSVPPPARSDGFTNPVNLLPARPTVTLVTVDREEFEIRECEIIVTDRVGHDGEVRSRRTHYRSEWRP